MVEKEFGAFPSHLKRRSSPQERREELQCRATIPRVPHCLSTFQRNLFSMHCFDFHAEDRLPPHGHVGQTCGKASWESHRSLDPLDRKCDTAATALEESASACPHWRRGLTPLRRLQKYPKIHVSTGEESSGSGPASKQGLSPGIDGRGIPRGPRRTRMATGVS